MTVSKSFAEYMADLKAQTAQVGNPSHGYLIVGGPVALKKCDWWYIGAWCVVYKWGKWFSQPYDSYTDFFLEKDDAIAYWESNGEGLLGPYEVEDED